MTNSPSRPIIDSSSSIVPVALHRIKRERSADDDEEQQTRRVARRVESDVITTASMSQLLLDDLQTDNDAYFGKVLGKLVELFGNKDADELASLQAEFFQLGGHRDIVKLMRDHHGNFYAQHYLLRTLVHVTLQNKDLIMAVTEIRGLAAIVYSIKSHSDTFVANAGLQALYNMSAVEENAKHLVNKLDIMSVLKKVSNIDGPNMIWVDHWSCSLLYRLGSFQQLRARLIQEKALTFLSHAIEKSGCSENVRDVAERAWKRLVAKE